jgi:hypothetical protein
MLHRIRTNAARFLFDKEQDAEIIPARSPAGETVYSSVTAR